MVSLPWPAVVAREAVSAGVWVLWRVGLVGAASAGGLGVLGRGLCGRARSADSVSVARRRMDVAAVFFMRWSLFSGGLRYGDGFSG